VQRAIELRNTLTRLGPAYIKLGQVGSREVLPRLVMGAVAAEACGRHCCMGRLPSCMRIYCSVLQPT
jgi:hypothetical protein